MRKVSAHYYLKPDGSFGKRPIIELDAQGQILSVREMGEAFKEEPGLEYFPGIIVPGFIAISPDVKAIKNTALSNGVLRVAKSTSTREGDKAWTQIKEQVFQHNSQTNLSSVLNKFTSKMADKAGEKGWGVIEQGACPGLLVLKNIDLRNFTMRYDATFKIIQR